MLSKCREQLKLSSTSYKSIAEKKNESKSHLVQSNHQVGREVSAHCCSVNVSSLDLDSDLARSARETSRLLTLSMFSR